MRTRVLFALAAWAAVPLACQPVPHAARQNPAVLSGIDAELRRQVESLLAQEGFLQELAGIRALTQVAGRVAPRRPTRFSSPVGFYAASISCYI